MSTNFSEDRDFGQKHRYTWAAFLLMALFGTVAQVLGSNRVIAGICLITSGGLCVTALWLEYRRERRLITFSTIFICIAGLVVIVRGSSFKTSRPIAPTQTITQPPTTPQGNFSIQTRGDHSPVITGGQINSIDLNNSTPTVIHKKSRKGTK
jgi:hypothetical protein